MLCGEGLKINADHGAGARNAGQGIGVHRANHGRRKTISIFDMQEQILFSVLYFFFPFLLNKGCFSWMDIRNAVLSGELQF